MNKTFQFTHKTKIVFSSADPIHVLKQLKETGVELLNIQFLDPLTVEFHVCCKPNDSIIRLLDHYTESYQISPTFTVFTALLNLFQRPVLLIGLLFIFSLTFFLPTRILFIQVSGNNIISENEIISQAANCGLRFGSDRREIRSEIVKNHLMSKIPQLQWVGVNTYGCVAVISVREEALKDTVTENHQIANIIAARDGIILNCTTLQGTQVCQPGQAVSKGQLLVSGYTNCGIYIQGTIAKGEVLAATQRNITYITPNLTNKRSATDTEIKRFQLIIGNNLIKFYKDSRISPATCVKIRKEYPLTLPGGLRLPISFVAERVANNEYHLERTSLSWAEACGREYLKSHMLAGKILSERVQSVELDGVTMYRGNYFCTEMIGHTKFEENIQAHGNDGKDSKR